MMFDLREEGEKIYAAPYGFEIWLARGSVWFVEYLDDGDACQLIESDDPDVIEALSREVEL